MGWRTRDELEERMSRSQAVGEQHLNIKIMQIDKLTLLMYMPWISEI